MTLKQAWIERCQLKAKSEKERRKMTLKQTWRKRCQLKAKSDLLIAKANKARKKKFNDGDSIESHKCWAEIDLLTAESETIWAKADLLWTDAILAIKGNISMEMINWHDDKHSYECHLSTGEVFVP